MNQVVRKLPKKETVMTDKFNIDEKAVKQLATLLTETGLTEIEYEVEKRRIRVSKISASGNIAYAPTPSGVPATTSTVHLPEPHHVSAVVSDGNNFSQHPGAVKSPMVGTAYVASEPKAPPLVRVGDIVQVGQVLLIVEAMKVMNPIRAPKAGKVTHILITDGMPVEYDDVLIVIE